jgi:ADP-ribosylglycohydrolase
MTLLIKGYPLKDVLKMIKSEIKLPIIKEWFEKEIEADDKSKLTPLDSDKRFHVKVAFIWAFYYLKNEWSYKEALKDVLKGGGDFITNASIVGGLIGAAQGQQAIEKKDVVLSFDPAIHGGQ